MTVKKRAHKKTKMVAYMDGTYSEEPDLPYPIVMYPSFYGFPFAFKKDINCEKSYLCECSKKAVENFIRIVSLTNETQFNICASYRNEFPYGFLDYIEREYKTSDFGYILTKHSSEIFKEGLCHYCNKTIPSYSYCIPMYGSKFVQEFGWYRKMKQIEYGLYRGTLILPDMIPDILQNFVIELENLSPETDEKRISEINKILYDYAENIVRKNWGVKFIGRRWNTETKLFDYVDNIFKGKKVLFHFRPDWLDGLELDIFVPYYNLAIEYQGIQHYRPIKHWGGEEGFITRRANDLRKQRICEGKGVTLIYFTYLEEITEELVIKKISPYINTL